MGAVVCPEDPLACLKGGAEGCSRGRVPGWHRRAGYGKLTCSGCGNVEHGASSGPRLPGSGPSPYGKFAARQQVLARRLLRSHCLQTDVLSLLGGARRVLGAAGPLGRLVGCDAVVPPVWPWAGGAGGVGARGLAVASLTVATGLRLVVAVGCGERQQARRSARDIIPAAADEEGACGHVSLCVGLLISVDTECGILDLSCRGEEQGGEGAWLVITEGHKHPQHQTGEPQTLKAEAAARMESPEDASPSLGLCDRVCQPHVLKAGPVSHSVGAMVVDVRGLAEFIANESHAARRLISRPLRGLIPRSRSYDPRQSKTSLLIGLAPLRH
ncbi:hypothetical protein EYF80_036858 [Liparis tanakae]|uniref:Uncharacterized protein n=1 Tax=Liparis tanakae TaxID=230148 RepID=A0A4Z2GHX4_9TELE|nr:hypothetical protein EYF80_036858 [Liparis tanakae]